jgi:hypothetical protein
MKKMNKSIANEDIIIEKFYVYRMLDEESRWGAVILGDKLTERLPNLAFGMKVFAPNEKEAIAKAKVVYDRIHAYDSDKENIRRFASAVLKSFSVYARGAADKEIAEMATEVMKFAAKTNEEYNKYFRELEE